MRSRALALVLAAAVGAAPVLLSACELSCGELNAWLIGKDPANEQGSALLHLQPGLAPISDTSWPPAHTLAVASPGPKGFRAAPAPVLLRLQLRL